jgi:UDP-N-acetylglucosamine/UDP-N-acetylgalactosamine diphosphorylase
MGIEWLNVFAVDNVLQKIADPIFVGATIMSGCPAGAKVVRKVSPDERVGVMCKENGKPSIVEYYELTQEMMEAKDKSGEPAYNYGVILNYLFKVDKLVEINDNKMVNHMAEKKIPHIDDSGELVEPDEPNGYKFETLILDMINMLDDCLVFEVDRNKEFAPVKNKEGVDSIDTARELLKYNGVEI